MRYPTLLKNLASLLLPFVLLLACQKQPVDPTPAPAPGPVQKGFSPLEYSATVTDGSGTRAATDELNHYVFEDGDRLYVEYKEGDDCKMFGFLAIYQGVGSSTASFAGILSCADGFYPSDDTPLSATLISVRDSIHTFNTDGTIKAERSYPATFADNMPDAVSKFGDFTGSSTYGDASFTLNQTSAFLVFSVKYKAENLPVDTPVEAMLFNGTDLEPLRSGSVLVADSGQAGITSSTFAAAFPGDDVTLTNARLVLKWGTGTDPDQELPIPGSASALASNRYYNVFRYTAGAIYDGFHIRAKEDGTSVTINYTYSQKGIEISTDNGSVWTQYDGSAINLNADEMVCVRGSATSYNNSTGADWDSPSTNPIFTADNLCYIGGDIMSLTAGDGTLTTRAFSGAFGKIDYVDIDPADPLILSAKIIPERCYSVMFQECASLTNPPVIEATTTAKRSFNGMFHTCAMLTSYPYVLPALTMAEDCYRSMFQGCTSLESVNADLLPASTLASNCYYEMFNGCSMLSDAPSVLPAEILKSGCYQKMFYGCTSLETAPSISATTVANNSCQQMFYGCTSLTTPPSVLPAETLASNCYNEMFRGCTSLTTAPTLPATMLANACYYHMFYECKALVSAPELPAMVLYNACYQEMFRGCTSLIAAPALPATTSASRCYYQMFRGCSSLVTAPTELPATTLYGDCYREMFYGCTSLETAPSISATTVANNSCQQMFYGCTSLTTPPSVLPAETLASNCYNEMFRGCTSLTTAPTLPATMLANACYYHMFYECKALVSAPELPAMVLYNDCYQEMFRGCTSLITAPNLPATTLANNCYSGMFWACSNLTTAPSVLPATELKESCYMHMFDNCKLSNAPSLPATTLVKNCYNLMFYGCPFETAPDLLATDLVEGCYRQMFQNCTNLTYVKCLARTGINTSNSTTNWMNGVGTSGTRTFVKHTGATWPTGNNGIPSNWSVTEATE